MEYRQYEIVRENGIWHVYDQAGHRVTRMGFTTKKNATAFLAERFRRLI